MDRKLVSIQKIIEISPIPNADMIEVAKVLGWLCVVKKGEFRVGDLCCYFEIDSLIPNKEWSSFLFKGSNIGKETFRLKTARLRGQISQGLAMPVTILNESDKAKRDIDLFMGDSICISEEAVGKNLTEYLDVEKYDPPIPAQLSGVVKGYIPSFIYKTDETRIQAEPTVLERHKGKQFYISEKIDGASMTVYLNNGEFGVCSRTLDLKETKENSLWKVARKLDLENRLGKLNFNVAIQGEIHGEGIQKNKYKLKGQHFRAFNILNIDSGSYLSYEEFIDICKLLNVNTVPIITATFILNHSVEDLVELSNGQSILNLDIKREGIVFRPIIEERDTALGRLSFKVISPNFLLKYGE